MTSRSADNWVLAIDGGGTCCRFALARATDPASRAPGAQTGTERVVIEGGPANATTNFAATIECINQGIASLAQTAGQDIESVNLLPAFVGLAGVTGSAIAARLQRELPLRHARYEEDRLAALRGALGTRDGIVAHCGTGSFFATQRAGAQRFAGGWGSILGDEASAHWVGQRALSLALQQVDGFLPATRLTDIIHQRFKHTDDIIAFAASATPDDYGKLAPIVTEQAQRSDKLAMQIMQAAADYIAWGVNQMDWCAGTPICLTGGIAPHYSHYLPKEKRVDLTLPVGTPLDGAIELALAQREHTIGYR